MALGRLVLEPLNAVERQITGLADTEIALQAKHAGQYGDHSAGKKAGFKKGDILVNFDSKTHLRTETELIAYVLQNRMPGVQIPVTVLRSGKRVHLKLPVQ